MDEDYTNNMVYVRTTSSGVSPGNFFIGVRIGMAIIAVVCVVAEKYKKK